MTDTLGSEPHNQQEETPPAIESEVAQESQETETEVPQEPSEYEFSDEPPSEDQPSEKPVRRSAFLPIAAAVGGILLLGSVAWWQLTGGASFSLPPPINKAVSGGLSLPARPTAAPETKTNETEAGSASLKIDSVAQKVDASPVQSSPDIASSAHPSLPETPAAQAKPLESLPQSAPTGIPPAMESAPAPISALPAPVSAVPTGSPAVDARRIETLTARVESLQKALDQANQQVSQMTTALAASSNAQTALPAATKEMQAKIDRLEQQLATATRAAKAPAETPSAVAQSVSEENPVAPKTEATASSKPRTTHKIAHQASKQAPTKTTSSLVLRAALVGHAWVAKSTTSTELTEIIVGDRVSGVGTVTAIEEQDGKWIVRGTKGTIQ